MNSNRAVSKDEGCSRNGNFYFFYEKKSLKGIFLGVFFSYFFNVAKENEGKNKFDGYGSCRGEEKNKRGYKRVVGSSRG